MNEKFIYDDFIIVKAIYDERGIKILRVQHKKNGKEYAIKAIALTDQLKKIGKQEENIMSKLNHPNIINFLGSFEETKRSKDPTLFILSLLF